MGLQGQLRTSSLGNAGAKKVLKYPTDSSLCESGFCDDFPGPRRGRAMDRMAFGATSERSVQILPALTAAVRLTVRPYSLSFAQSVDRDMPSRRDASALLPCASSSASRIM